MVITALRMFVRYLIATDQCRVGLDAAIPSFAGWCLSALPRYLPAADVERVLAVCDPTTVAGSRDHAILLLLSRLGLRAGDIQALRLGDIDWIQAPFRLTVNRAAEFSCHRSRHSGKSRLVPLHPSAQAGLERYLELRRRLGGGDEHLFISMRNRALHYQTVLETFQYLVRERWGCSRIPVSRALDLAFMTFATVGPFGHWEPVRRAMTTCANMCSRC